MVINLKRFKWLIIPLLFLSLTACENSNKEEVEEDSNVQSATENLETYTSLLNDINDKGDVASTSEYYETNFSYSISYVSGRTNYNVVTLDRTCKVRNEDLYILKTTDYQYSSASVSNSKTIYLKENDTMYSYDYIKDVQTLDTEEILPCYEVSKLDDFNITDAFGFSQTALTSQSYDGTNGTITKENNVYTIEMSYAEVKDESLVKFIINLGYFSSMLSYVSEEDLKVNFIYTINDNGYKLDYGFSYEANTDTDEKEIKALVSLGLKSIEPFEITDFKDESKYVKKYTQNFTEVTDVYKVGDTVSGRYAGYALFKFYLTQGKYGVVSNGAAVTDYSVYDSTTAKISKYALSINEKATLNTNYFSVTEDGYYYIYIEISSSLKSFKLEEINYESYGTENIKSLGDTNEGTLEGLFDYDVYEFSIESTVKITITNKSTNNLCLIVPITTYFTNYRTIGIEAGKTFEFTLAKGSYYLIVSPYYASESLNYSFEITAESYL